MIFTGYVCGIRVNLMNVTINTSELCFEVPILNDTMFMVSLSSEDSDIEFGNQVAIIAINGMHLITMNLRNNIMIHDQILHCECLPLTEP